MEQNPHNITGVEVSQMVQFSLPSPKEGIKWEDIASERAEEKGRLVGEKRVDKNTGEVISDTLYRYDNKGRLIAKEFEGWRFGQRQKENVSLQYSNDALGSIRKRVEAGELSQTVESSYQPYPFEDGKVYCAREEAQYFGNKDLANNRYITQYFPDPDRGFIRVEYVEYGSEDAQKTVVSPFIEDVGGEF